MDELLSNERLREMLDWLHSAPVSTRLFTDMAKALRELIAIRAAGQVMPETPSGDVETEAEWIAARLVDIEYLSRQCHRYILETPEDAKIIIFFMLIRLTHTVAKPY